MNQPTLSHPIALGEGFTTEFEGAMPSDLGREISAFANATGGVILIGVIGAHFKQKHSSNRSKLHDTILLSHQCAPATQRPVSLGCAFQCSPRSRPQVQLLAGQ